MSTQADRYAQSLAQLLPPGLAYPTAPGSVWMAVVQALAGMFAELHDVAEQAVVEWQPHTTRNRLAEWEEALSLPDGCFGAALTLEQRRAQVLARLRGYAGAYDDSSPAALAAIEAFCLALGFPATAHYNVPFRVGRNRVGQRLGTSSAILHLVLAPAYAAQETQLRCALDRVVPARFTINLVYS